jgi:hypothetical protein
MNNNREFHIHIDARWLGDEFEKVLMEKLQFYLKNFSEFPISTARYAPDRHLTYKVDNRKVFEEKLDVILNFINYHPNSMSGYIEGEEITHKLVIPPRPFNTDILPPFKLELGSLPTGKFREDEIHITLDRDRSDPRLILSLRQMGFFSVYMDKDYGTAEIFTTQGSCRDVRRVLPLITNYLNEVGGAVNCVIKEETIVRSWMSSPDLQLPPVISTIQAFTADPITTSLFTR